MAVCASSDRASFARPQYLPGVELVSVAYREREFPMHAHDEYVVGTVTEGTEQLEVDRLRHRVALGDVLRLHPGEPHANRCLGSETLCYLVFYLPRAAISNVLGDADLEFPSPVISDPSLARSLADLHGALAAAGADRLAQESAFNTLVGLFSAQSRQGCTERNSGGGDAAMQRVRHWIDENACESFGLKDLALLSGLSVFRLAHLFKESAGLSPIAYRNQRRVAEARRLLLTGQPIASVAVQVGFADQSHLSRQFQRLVGVSPLRYRQQERPIS